MLTDHTLDHFVGQYHCAYTLWCLTLIETERLFQASNYRTSSTTWIVLAHGVSYQAVYADEYVCGRTPLGLCMRRRRYGFTEKVM